MIHITESLIAIEVPNDSYDHRITDAIVISGTYRLCYDRPEVLSTFSLPIGCKYEYICLLNEWNTKAQFGKFSFSESDEICAAVNFEILDDNKEYALIRTIK